MRIFRDLDLKRKIQSNFGWVRCPSVCLSVLMSVITLFLKNSCTYQVEINTTDYIVHSPLVLYKTQVSMSMQSKDTGINTEKEFAVES